MAINPLLLNLLVCPETGQALELQDQSVVEAINAQIAALKIFNRAGDAILTPFDGILLRSDKQIFYPVRSNIPIMLIEQSIIASGLL